VYAAFSDDESRVGLVRLEVAAAAGTGKLRTPSGMPKGIKESLQRAWSLVQLVKERQGFASILAQKDFAVEAVDLSGGGADGDCGVAFYVAMLSAIQNRNVQPGTVVLGDISVQGNIKHLPSISEPLQLALDNGALRALVPIANKAQVAGLPEEVAEKLDVVFYGDVDRALLKAVGG
jgi:ATP-dependent Lon protease